MSDHNITPRFGSVNEEPKTPWYKKKKTYFIGVPVILAIVIVNGIVGNGGEAREAVKGDSIKSTSQEATPPAEIAEPEPTEEPVAEPTEEPAPPAPTYSMGQKNAIDKGNSYLAFMAFSRSGLIEQLQYEGFTPEDATFAVDTIAPDWNAQAAAKAQSYVDMMAFSRDGLIDQLVFEGFTYDEASFGVTAIGY